MKKTVFFIFLCLFVGGVFAASNGVAGDSIISWFGKLLKTDPTTALGVFTSALTILGVVTRYILKLIPTSMQGIVGFVVWHVLAFFFGDGVKIENNVDQEYIKKQLTKKYPLLQIDVKKL